MAGCVRQRDRDEEKYGSRQIKIDAAIQQKHVRVRSRRWRLTLHRFQKKSCVKKSQRQKSFGFVKERAVCS